MKVRIFYFFLSGFCANKSVENVQKACLEFVSAPQPARAAGTHRSRVLHTRWTPPSVQNQLEWVGSTPYSRCSGHKLAAERATDGVPSEVMECET